MCDQQSLRSACADAQSVQSLCLSLEYFMIVKLLAEHHLECLSLKGGCRGSSESTHVKMPHCWKSHALAQFIIVIRTQNIIGSKRKLSQENPFILIYLHERERRSVLKWYRFQFFNFCILAAIWNAVFTQSLILSVFPLNIF